MVHLLLYSIVFTPFRRAYFLPSDSYAAQEVIFPKFAEKTFAVLCSSCGSGENLTLFKNFFAFLIAMYLKWPKILFSTDFLKNIFPFYQVALAEDEILRFSKIFLPFW